MARTTLDRRAAEIIGWHLEGQTDKDIAQLVSSKRRSYTPQAITQFRKRHKAEIETLRGKVAAAVEDKPHGPSGTWEAAVASAAARWSDAEVDAAIAAAAEEER